jgi:ribosome assembly protein 3
MSSKSDSSIAAEFQAYYLQRATKELAEDLDKVRNADDFKNDAIPLLIHALQQGTSMFSAEDKRRIVAGSKKDSEEGN